MGRRTFDILTPDNLPLQKEGTTMVLTTDEKAKSDNPTVVFSKGKAHDILGMLAKKGHNEAVIIGGAMTMSEFINARLVDDIYLVVEPVIFGNGLSLLQNVGLELKLNLLDVTKMNQSTIQVHYEML